MLCTSDSFFVTSARGTRSSRFTWRLPVRPFSCARDRSARTQLRSSSFPAGLPDLAAEQQEDVKVANRIARHTLDLAEWAAKELKAVVFLENPRQSYLWKFLEPHSPPAVPAWRDIVISQCRFGTPYKKDLVGFQRFGFPIGGGPVGNTKRCLPTQGYHDTLLESCW
jgi:hypothetical protein